MRRGERSKPRIEEEEEEEEEREEGEIDHTKKELGEVLVERNFREMASNVHNPS